MRRQLRERAVGWLLGGVGAETLVAAAPPVPMREIYRRFWPYARPYRHWLWAALGFILLDQALDTAVIWMFKLLVDDVLEPRHFAPFFPIALAYLALSLAGGIASFGDDYLSAWVGERFLLSLRTSFFRHLHGLSLDFFQKQRLGDVLSRLTGDIASIEDFILTSVTSALTSLLRIGFFLIALFYLRWELALASLIVAPLFWIAARVFSRLLKQASREKRRRSGSITALAGESLANAALVQAYNRQEHEVARFHREGQGKLAAELASTRMRSLFSPLTGIIELGGILVVIGLGTWELAQGRLTLGGLLVFMAYLSQLYSPIRRLSRLSNTIYSASASAERIIELLDRRPAVEESAAPAAIDRACGRIEFTDVAFYYPGEEHSAVEGLSFRVEPGQTVAFVGPSGAGKSTAVRLLLRFYDPTAGRITLDGRDLRDLRLHDLRENIAVVLQEMLIFEGTIRENIAFGRLGATELELLRAARAADAHEFITALPEGYDTMVGERGTRLSGGQRQRIAIARAMIRDAPILIFDEPTTGLDAESGQRILEPLRRLMHGRTTLVISHDLLTVREATTIIVLEGGHVTEQGTHQQLVDRQGTYARLYRLHHPDERADQAASHRSEGTMGGDTLALRLGES